MNFKKETYTTIMEILVTEANLVTFSGTVVADGLRLMKMVEKLYYLGL